MRTTAVRPKVNSARVEIARAARDNTSFHHTILAALLAVLATACTTLGLAASPHAQPTKGSVYVIEVTGAIGVGTGFFIQQSVDRAQADGASLLVIRLDTPGGLVSATREIIQKILSSPVPVVTYVAPSGARAASAGTFISYAAHVAAMAPGTHMGAATPVQMGVPGMPQSPSPGKSPEKDKASDGKTAMERKMVNDAVAYLRSLAQLRGRSEKWAEKFVADAATLTASEARKENVIDIVATDLDDLVRQLDGRSIKTKSGTVTLTLAGVPRTTLEPGWRARFLATITDPNIVFILLMIGIYGIIFEFWSPGLAGPGIIGAICLIVALMGLSALPVNYAGLALIVLGMILMATEAFSPGFGILGIGGIVAFIAGALFLFDPSGADFELAVYWPVIIAAAATSALLLAGVLGMVVHSRRRRIATGREQMIGLEGRVVEWSAENGKIQIHGERWHARSDNALAPGSLVRVTALDGLTLIVEPAKKGAS